MEREFNQSLTVIKPLLQQIKETYMETNEMIYDLYGLTPGEREIVEESLTN